MHHVYIIRGNVNKSVTNRYERSEIYSKLSTNMLIGGNMIYLSLYNKPSVTHTTQIRVKTVFGIDAPYQTGILFAFFRSFTAKKKSANERGKMTYFLRGEEGKIQFQSVKNSNIY